MSSVELQSKQLLLRWCGSFCLYYHMLHVWQYLCALYVSEDGVHCVWLYIRFSVNCMITAKKGIMAAKMGHWSCVPWIELISLLLAVVHFYIILPVWKFDFLSLSALCSFRTLLAGWIIFSSGLPLSFPNSLALPLLFLMISSLTR